MYSKKRKFIGAGTKNLEFDYKDSYFLKTFVNEAGKIVPRRITGLSAKEQRKLTRAIKNSRIAGLMSFCSKH